MRRQLSWVWARLRGEAAGLAALVSAPGWHTSPSAPVSAAGQLSRAPRGQPGVLWAVSAAILHSGSLPSARGFSLPLQLPACGFLLLTRVVDQLLFQNPVSRERGHHWSLLCAARVFLSFPSRIFWANVTPNRPLSPQLTRDTKDWATVCLWKLHLPPL